MHGQVGVGGKGKGRFSSGVVYAATWLTNCGGIVKIVFIFCVAFGFGFAWHSADLDPPTWASTATTTARRCIFFILFFWKIHHRQVFFLMAEDYKGLLEALVAVKNATTDLATVHQSVSPRDQIRLPQKRKREGEGEERRRIWELQHGLCAWRCAVGTHCTLLCSLPSAVVAVHFVQPLPPPLPLLFLNGLSLCRCLSTTRW